MCLLSPSPYQRIRKRGHDFFFLNNNNKKKVKRWDRFQRRDFWLEIFPGNPGTGIDFYPKNFPGNLFFSKFLRTPLPVFFSKTGIPVPGLILFSKTGITIAGIDIFSTGVHIPEINFLSKTGIPISGIGIGIGPRSRD